MSKALVGITVFSLIEALGWATIAAIIVAEVTATPFLKALFSDVALKVLLAGFGYGFVEHVIALNTGRKRPLFEIPRGE